MIKNKSIMAICVVFALLVCGFVSIAAAGDGLAEQYAPVLYFEKDEECYPVNVSYLLDDGNSELKTITIEGNVVSYYDNIHGTVTDDGIIDDYKQKESSLGYTVYYHESTEAGVTVIQYWMFYAFNKGEENQHESDWEMVQITIPSGGDKSVGYSQHYSGQSATWGQVEKTGDHFKVYVARGSHANYLRPYSGKLGIANDIVADNGKVLNPDQYTLVELSSQEWLSFAGLWGEVNSVEDFVLGRAGPNGPQFRQDMSGNLMWSGSAWGSGLLPANDMLFNLEWFLYNFIMIVILITLLTLAVMGVRIYLRKKKYGLGPRIVSMFYIDGFNLKSIGNILCFVGIIIGIIGLFSTWYVVSADINVAGFETTGATDVISVHGWNGVQVTMPGLETGPVPMGSATVPFGLVLLLGLFLMIPATIGVHRSRKLGMKYLFRGIRFVIAIVILIVAIMAIGFVIPSGSSGLGGDYVSGLLKSMSSSPMGGEYSFTITEANIAGDVNMKWGLGMGAMLILVSGIIFIVSGALEIAANKVFFETKIPVEKQKRVKKKPPVEQQPSETKKE